QYDGRVYYHGTGCEKCFNTGYKGRIGVFEILTMNDALRRSIVSGADSTAFRELCQKSEDYVSMSENADQLVEKGITTVEEVCRTILVTD
ncbi:MAG: type II secretion system protein GspE, partial [Lachnospiraceae bacterium]|nr:type II secretion system protein GspE [Lachnospiraceae bacterium]